MLIWMVVVVDVVFGRFASLTRIASQFAKPIALKLNQKRCKMPKALGKTLETFLRSYTHYYSSECSLQFKLASQASCLFACKIEGAIKLVSTHEKSSSIATASSLYFNIIIIILIQHKECQWSSGTNIYNARLQACLYCYYAQNLHITSIAITLIIIVIASSIAMPYIGLTWDWRWARNAASKLASLHFCPIAATLCARPPVNLNGLKHSGCSWFSSNKRVLCVWANWATNKTSFAHKHAHSAFVCV